MFNFWSDEMEETMLNGESLDIVSENIKKLKEIFPEVISEDKIDFEALKLILGENIVKEGERFSFSWSGKNKAIKKTQETSSGTLRPCQEESRNWEDTKNLYIEGDNVEVLKLLQKSYFNKISAIYIDPPYNTGNDIIYKNDYSDPIDYYLKVTGQRVIKDGESIDVITNTESNGRYHTNWLNMMYPCLKLARNLLNQKGIIFIAIDDYEISNLKSIANEIFGEPNYVGTLVTKCNPQGRGKKNLDPVHEYHLIYAKNIEHMEELKIKRNNNGIQEYQSFLRTGTNSRRHERPNRYYPMLVKDNKVDIITPEEYEKIYVDGSFDEDHLKNIQQKYEDLGYQVIFPIASNGEEKVWQRKYERVVDEYTTYIYDGGKIKTPKSDLRTPQSLWDGEFYSNVQYGTNLLLKMFDNKKTFEYPKSMFTVKELLSTTQEGIILDFFAGSSTTAHSVFCLNAENQSNYNFILVQIPAPISEDKDAFSLGYKNICEIGKDRIRKAGDEILQKTGNEKLDIGFKVFKLDSSNFEKWDPDYNNLKQSLLSAKDNIKYNRSKEDLIYEILLKNGLDLTLPIEEYKMNENIIFSIGYGALLVCLDDHITQDIAPSIIELSKDSNTKRVVFKDNGFESVSDKSNLKQILKMHKIDEFITI